MDKQDLIQLQKLSSLTPEQIRQQQPALFDKLSTRASISLKAIVESKLKNVPETIKAGLLKVDFNPAKLGKLDVRAALKTAVLDNGATPEKKSQVEKEFNALPNLGKVDDILQPDLPVLVNPGFQPDLQKAKLYRLSDITGLTQMTVDKAMVKDLSINTISEEKLDELVKNSILTADEAKRLGFASNLYTFFNADFDLVDAARNLPNVKSMEDLTRLNATDWEQLVTKSGVKLPDGVTAKEYAGVLAKKTELLYPSLAWEHRLEKPDTTPISKGLPALKTLQDKNPGLFGKDFNDLNTDGINATELDNARTAYTNIERLSRTYPGLKIAETLNDSNVAADVKIQTITGRINTLKNFLQNNRDADILNLQLTHDSDDLKTLNFQGIKPEEQPMVTSYVKSYQRIYSIANDAEHTDAILAAGYHSAYHITSVTFDDFVNTTKLSPVVAERYFEQAHNTIIRTTGLLGSILDIVGKSFDWTGVGNFNPNLHDYLKQIPGYQDFFGEIPFCDCEHCQSIFSPAAYFVDLMQLVHQYVTSKYFTGGNANHVLNLKVRRPDLWALPLTCENTNTLIPYLDIINEILESYIAVKRSFPGDLADRSAVETFVYKTQIALERPGAWKNDVHAFTQPYHLPLESVSTYLGHFEKTRKDIAVLLNQPQPEVSKARLCISEKEMELITVADSNPGFINRVYDIPFNLVAGKIEPFNAQLLLKPVGVSRKELDALVKTKFITDNGNDAIVIQGEKINAASIQNDIERAKNFTYDVLDRMHRFVRLWKKTKWSIDVLDLVLSQLQQAGISTGIQPATVTAIGRLLSLNDKLKFKPEELIAFWRSIPVIALDGADKSMFNRLFNPEDAVRADGAYPKPSTLFIHPSLIIDRSTTPAEFSSGRLMSALNRSDAEVLQLIQGLATPLGVTNISAAVESQRGFFLTLPNLSLLYRHSVLADFLKVTIPQMFQLIKLVNLPAGFVENIQHAESVLAFHEGWKSSGFSLDELHFITGSTNIVTPEQFKSKDDITKEVLDQVRDTHALQFAGTLFAYFDDVTEEQSKAIIIANNTIIEATADGRYYQLKPLFNPATPITVPAGITRPEPELRDMLTRYHPQKLVPYFLSGPLGLSEYSITALTAALGVNLDNDAYTLELQGVTTPAAALPALVENLIPLGLLFRDKKYTSEAIDFVLAHLLLFEIASLSTITINNIQRLLSFTALLTQTNEEYNTADVIAVINAFTTANQFNLADADQLAGVLQAETAQIASITAAAGIATNAIDGLNRLKRFAEVTSLIGVGGNILQLIASTSYDELNQATNALIAAFRTKYRTEAERKEKIEAYENKLRGRKRAALTTFLIHSGFPQFEKEDDLFHYFLIDTQLEGCARTSRLVAATMSLQLYVHRILLNLEQDAQPLGTPGKMHILPKSIPADEWPWRKNYRVWEANRKVFLYPENYIEPELRDDKTFLFKELESDLLQQEINADNVLEAYGKYMSEFDQLAHLKIAGSYHEKDADSETDVLHLFGVTADDPGLYYYRRIENLYYSEKNDNRGIAWNAWQKINVQIPVRSVAPIVFNGRLHAFWVNITTLANTVFDKNQSVFIGYSHKFSIEYTTLKLDGTWTPPQKLALHNEGPFTGNGVIQDPLAEDSEIASFRDELHDMLRSFPFFDLSGVNDAIRNLRTPRYDTRPHFEVEDEYTLKGFLWNQVYPSVDKHKLILTGAGYQMRAAIDFYDLSIQDAGIHYANGRESLILANDRAGKILVRDGRNLYRAASPGAQLFDSYAYGTLLVKTSKGNTLLERHWNKCTLDQCFDNVRHEQIATLPSGTTVSIINGAYGDAIIDAQGDVLLLQGTPIDGNGFLARRLNTTISETLTRTLFTSGVDTMLEIRTQEKLKEAPIPISITNNRINNLVVRDKIDFKGAYGVYYREIFFHIPFLIANHLNSQGKYAEAQKWYHYIFNPTSTEVVDVSDPSLTPAQKKKMQLDRNWKYIEFRGLNISKLREELTNKLAIEAYKKDPFNPHAIARLRLSAYQKCIVMKYIDNLLDWGDQLFTQDTMESVNEATLLYIIAKEILGERPAELGSCGEGKVHPKTYEKIAPLLGKGSEFLAELETYTFVKNTGAGKPFRKNTYLRDNTAIYSSSVKALASSSIVRRAGAFADSAITVNAGAVLAGTGAVTAATAGSTTSMMMNTGAALAGHTLADNISMRANFLNGISVNDAKIINDTTMRHLPEVTIKPIDEAATGVFAKGPVRATEWRKPSFYTFETYKLPHFGRSLIKHVSPVFCVPGNKDLLEYWKRVDDRLFKIRNCMNIQGQVRQLALFAPEIDPRLLVRARAAGLSLDDILNSINGNLPPYRFAFILEKAKTYAATVQSFGSALLSALEKKDAEELSLIRLHQQQNILEMSSKSRRLEIDSMNETIKAMNDKVTSISEQLTYFNMLIEERVNTWENLQSAGRHTASIVRGTEATVGFAAALLRLLPQLGSPFAMKYGGLEIGGSLGRIAQAMNSLAALGDNVAASAGLEAGFERRSDGWRHQKDLLDHELTQTQKNLKAIEIRRDILIESEKIHLKSIQHNDDLLEFYGDKFSNLGLYTYLSTTMRRLFREAYNNAFSIARLAEQAYRFERDDTAIFVENNYFESSRAGLLAGEKLTMALQAMERRYLETNYRKNEIDQAFSLTQIDPAALLTLKQTGTCTFTIPEVFFDLFYPGQYRRRVQSVRLTIPSVTGPYTNISASLALQSSKIRMEARLGAAELRDVPRSRTTNIATSTAQNDAGVFALNFRDDRYMPFEGAGAISTWKLSLPRNFRQFDYNSINDVLIHISYTAEYDELFRDRVETMNDAIEGTLLNILKNNSLARSISLRQEFSTDFHRLTQGALNQAVSISIQNKHFPLFMNGRTLSIRRAKLVLVTPAAQTAGTVAISINGTPQTGFGRDSTLGNLFTKDLGSLFNAGIIRDHQVTITNAGDLAPAAPPPGSGPVAAIDTSKLEDIVLYLEYRIG